MNSKTSHVVDIFQNVKYGSYIECKAFIINQPDLLDHHPIFLFQKDNSNGSNVLDRMTNQQVVNSINQQKQEFYYDRDSLMSKNDFHYIQIPYSSGKYTIQFRDLQDDASLKVDLNIYIRPRKQCYKECKSCDFKDLQCQCESNFGKACQYPYENIDPNYKYSFYKTPSQWSSFAFDLKKGRQYEIGVYGIDRGTYFQFLLKDISVIQAPNFYENTTQITTSAILKRFSKETIQKYIDLCRQSSNCNDATIVISLYFPSDSNPSDHSILELRESKNSEGDGIYFILLLVIGILLTIASLLSCGYVCYKERKHQREQIMQQQQIMAQNNSINPGSQQIQQQQNGPRIIIQKVAITQQSIEKYMPIIQYQEIIRDMPQLNDQTECIVCLCQFEQEDECRMTVCFHIFHKQCIDNWIKKHGNCPFCRHKLTKKTFEDHLTLKTEVLNNPYMKKIVQEAQSDCNSPLSSKLSKMKEFDFIFNEGDKSINNDRKEEPGSPDQLISSSDNNNPNRVILQQQNRSRFFAGQNDEFQDRIQGDSSSQRNPSVHPSQNPSQNASNQVSPLRNNQTIQIQNNSSQRDNNSEQQDSQVIQDQQADVGAQSQRTNQRQESARQQQQNTNDDEVIDFD